MKSRTDRSVSVILSVCLSFSIFCCKSVIVKDVPKVFDNYTLIVKKVVSVQDGDTVLLEDNKKLRYLGINAPEITSPGGIEADEFNRKLVHNKTCYIFAKTGEDVFDRLLGYVYVQENGKYVNVNRLLLEKGLAEISVEYGGIDLNLPLYLTAEEIQKIMINKGERR